MTGLAVCKTAAAYEWDLVPCGADAVALQEISEFRGRILYAGGRRPAFRRHDGQYADDDPLDSQSIHIAARAGGELVGYARLRPLPEHCESSLAKLATREQFDAALEEMQLTRNDCLEASRWMVARAARGTSVAPTLVVSAWAVGRWLGKRRLLATVGARDGQATMLARFGGRAVHGVYAKFIAEYDDDVETMQFDLEDPPPRVASKLEAVGQLLRLHKVGLSGVDAMDAVHPWIWQPDVLRW